LVESVCTGLRRRGIDVAEGVFGAHMEVELLNSGPVTIIMETADGQVV
jgi:D-tyrosyl-tRNA(Tyr) deacylase